MTVGVILACTDKGLSFLETVACQQHSTDVLQAVIAAFGLGLIIFTSEATGYIFTAIPLFYWNVFRDGFYSCEWKRLSYDPKDSIIASYNADRESSSPPHRELDSQLLNSSTDIFLSYFWQQAPEGIVEWVMRRYTAFFSGLSAALGIWIGCILSAAVAIMFSFAHNLLTYILYAAWVSAGLILLVNAQIARQEGRQMVDLWLAGRLNPVLGSILKKTMN